MSQLRRLISSTNALFVFEAAARLGSFSGAAAELNVTQPAVSRMLGILELDMGCKLFDRRPTGARLTDDGQVLFRVVSSGFGTIEAVIREIKERSKTSGEAATLSVSSGFAAHWLMPRFERFQQMFPTIDLRFQLISGRLEGSIRDVDLGMRFDLPKDIEYQSLFDHAMMCSGR